MSLRRTALLATSGVLFAWQAQAAVCDYTPSRLVGKSTTAVGASVAGGSAVAGAGLHAAGIYTLVHASSGLTMLGSTMAGASAAGTIGIISGTGGLIGAAGALLLAPVTIAVGSIVAAGVGTFEGVCYFQIERVEDPVKVHEIVRDVVAQSDDMAIVETADGDALRREITETPETYLLKDLYIADSKLMHRDFGPDTVLGAVSFVVAENTN